MAETAVAETLAESFVIEGGRPLEGRVRAAGNKNAALPLLAACVLAQDEVRLENVPRIRDVETMMELLTDIGGEAEWTGPNEVRVNGAPATRNELSESLCSRMRASILLAGPLLARFGRAVVPAPGGDPIGRRRLDVHMHALAELGADVRYAQPFEFRAERLHRQADLPGRAERDGNRERNHGLRHSAKARRCSVNAACEPHVQDLCEFLVSLGARIEGIGSNMLRIEGVRELGGGTWRICPDHVEVGSFIGCAAVTGGDVTIDECRPDDLVSILPAFERLGIRVEVEGSSIRVPPGQELAVRKDLGAMIPKIEDGPWPAFPADLTSIALIVATQARVRS